MKFQELDDIAMDAVIERNKIKLSIEHLKNTVAEWLPNPFDRERYDQWMKWLWIAAPNQIPSLPNRRRN